LPTETAAAGAFVVALLTVLAATPVAIRVAHRLSFYDQPGGYKAHPRATPYLGGAAVVAGFSLGAVLFAGVDRRALVILGGAFLLLVVGTVDDRRTVRPSVRLVATSGTAVALFASGIGWSIFNGDAANLALTLVWVIGAVNAFNLMDNMDGAGATVAAVSATGIGVLGVVEDDARSAALAFAVAGACVAFLKYNLTSPARIFLGDGGSMPLGFVLAAATMSLPELSDGGVSTLIPAALLVGLAIFDTTLVIVSRSRRRVRIYSGGRDHMTHRLLPLLRSPRGVAAVLALAQASLCALAVIAVTVGTGTEVVLAVSCASIGAIVLWAFERMSAWSAPARGGASVGGPAVVSAVEVTTHGYQESDHPGTLTPIE
jgi:UDP-GlcNAc:undecaprenyl-phosphate/decaprenyl-phosphate GlcNAc-1-phosphate transferase